MRRPAVAGPQVGEAVVAVLVQRRRSARRWELLSFRSGLVLIVGLVLLAVFHSALGLPNPNQQNLSETLQPPSAAHLFGTDTFGRDLLSRCVSALSLDLRVSVVVTAVSVLIGVTLGLMAGFLGSAIDGLIMRLADIVLAFPFMVLVIAIIAAVGPGLTGVYIAVPAVGWALYARFVRGEMLSVRERDFVSAARTLGYSRRRILLIHALPNVVQSTIVYSAIDVVLNIAALATLSYLGLGVQPPSAELGGIISEGQQYVLTAWWIAVIPGLFLVLVGIGFSLIGDGLAARLDQDVSWSK